MLPIAHIQNEDERFVRLVSRVASSIIEDLRPADVFVTRIDHWFDHKWLGFSGKLMGAVGVHKLRLTIPLFNPRRVLSHHAYSFDPVTASYQTSSTSPLHRHQSSGGNLTRYVDHLSQSGVFIWFSGGTVDADHGCVMVYTSHTDSQGGWYASFRRADDWRLHKVEGLSKAELMGLVERDAHEHES